MQLRQRGACQPRSEGGAAGGQQRHQYAATGHVDGDKATQPDGWQESVAAQQHGGQGDAGRRPDHAGQAVVGAQVKTQQPREHVRPGEGGTLPVWGWNKNARESWTPNPEVDGILP